MINTPTNLVTRKVANGVILAWDDTSNTEHGFEVWSSLSNAPFVLITTTAMNVNTYTHICGDGDDRMYKVRAKGGNLLSVDSSIKGFTKTLGAELINQLTWFTIAYWDSIDANFTQDGSTLLNVNTAGNWLIAKNNFWVFGKTYEIRISVSGHSGYRFFPPIAITNGTGFKIETNGDFVYTYTPSATTLYMFCITCAIRITALSIKELTIAVTP